MATEKTLEIQARKNAPSKARGWKWISVEVDHRGTKSKGLTYRKQ